MSDAELNELKGAKTRCPVHELIARRWSPRSFADRPVEREKICSLLEAARWAPSSYNEQPWRFLVATREDPDTFERLSSCLIEGNRSWASRAPVLILTIAKTFLRDDPQRRNRHAFHDVGLATAQLVLQATALDLYAHQMGGFDRERARELFAIPEGYEPLVVLAVGYLGDPGSLPPDLQGRERVPRTRKELEEIAYQERFGRPLAFEDPSS